MYIKQHLKHVEYTLAEAARRPSGLSLGNRLSLQGALGHLARVLERPRGRHEGERVVAPDLELPAALIIFSNNFQDSFQNFAQL